MTNDIPFTDVRWMHGPVLLDANRDEVVFTLAKAITELQEAVRARPSAAGARTSAMQELLAAAKRAVYQGLTEGGKTIELQPGEPLRATLINLRAAVQRAEGGV